MRSVILTACLYYLSFSNAVYAQHAKAIEINYEQTKNGFIFYGVNNSNVPYYVKFQFSELQNLEANQDISKYFPTVYPNKERIALLTLKQKAADKKSSFNFNYIFTVGNSDLDAQEDFVYLLPYKHGKRVRVGQGNNGSGTHKGLNAIDFNLDIGDSIYAARDGFVYEIKENSNKGGNNLAYEKDGNFINVYHADGTLAKYVHLKQNGAIAKVGDNIKAGQLIGISGNTGYSSGPHLHFVVVHNKDFEANSIKAKFLNHKEEAFIPKESESYYAYHPGGEPFEVQDETTFNEHIFEMEELKATIQGEINIASETYGDYTLLYINNGLGNTVDGTLNLELTNMKATKALPFSFTVKADSKKYLLAITPQKKAEEYSYKLSLSFKR